VIIKSFLDVLKTEGICLSSFSNSKPRSTGFCTDSSKSELTSNLAKKDEFEDGETLEKFLDFLWLEVEAEPSKLVPYTQEMYDEDMELVAGVPID